MKSGWPVMVVRVQVPPEVLKALRKFLRAFLFGGGPDSYRDGRHVPMKIGMVSNDCAGCPARGTPKA